MVICRASLSLLRGILEEFIKRKKEFFVVISSNISKDIFKKMVWYNSLSVIIGLIVTSGCVYYMRKKFNLEQLQNFLIFLDALLSAICVVGILVSDLIHYFLGPTATSCLFENQFLLLPIPNFVLINFINASTRYASSIYSGTAMSHNALDTLIYLKLLVYDSEICNV